MPTTLILAVFAAIAVVFIAARAARTRRDPQKGQGPEANRGRIDPPQSSAGQAELTSPQDVQKGQGPEANRGGLGPSGGSGGGG